MAIVVPAILEDNFPEIEQKIEWVTGLVDWVQIDFADKTLVPNKTFLDPDPFKKYTSGPLQFEAHLMVNEPLSYVDQFAKAGFKRFYAHVEANQIEEFIEKCYQLGVEVGLAIDGPTPLEKVKPYIDNIDVLLVLAIEAGFSGQPFLESTVDRIKQLKEWEFDLPIAVDGAMTDINAAKVVAAGASIICSNSYIFAQGDVRKPIEKLKSLELTLRKSMGE